MTNFEAGEAAINSEQKGHETMNWSEKNIIDSIKKILRRHATIIAFKNGYPTEVVEEARG